MCSCANHLQNINIKSNKIATSSHFFFFKVGDKMEGWMNHAVPINTEIEVFYELLCLLWLECLLLQMFTIIIVYYENI